jgi:hypothetical protein
MLARHHSDRRVGAAGCGANGRGVTGRPSGGGGGGPWNPRRSRAPRDGPRVRVQCARAGGGWGRSDADPALPGGVPPSGSGTATRSRGRECARPPRRTVGRWARRRSPEARTDALVAPLRARPAATCRGSAHRKAGRRRAQLGAARPRGRHQWANRRTRALPRKVRSPGPGPPGERRDHSYGTLDRGTGRGQSRTKGAATGPVDSPTRRADQLSCRPGPGVSPFATASTESTASSERWTPVGPVWPTHHASAAGEPPARSISSMTGAGTECPLSAMSQSRVSCDSRGYPSRDAVI